MIVTGVGGGPTDQIRAFDGTPQEILAIFHATLCTFRAFLRCAFKPAALFYLFVRTEFASPTHVSLPRTLWLMYGPAQFCRKVDKIVHKFESFADMAAFPQPPGAPRAPVLRPEARLLPLYRWCSRLWSGRGRDAL